MAVDIDLHMDELAEVCDTYGVRRLEVFGSAFRGDFDPEQSDINIDQAATLIVGFAAGKQFSVLISDQDKGEYLWASNGGGTAACGVAA